jgi:hypothetical protein
LNKQALNGSQKWVKFYNNPYTTFLLNIAYVDSTGELFTHFVGGVIAFISAEDGSVSKAKHLSGQYQEAGNWDKASVMYDSGLDNIFSATGMMGTDGGNDYTFSLFQINTDLTVLKDYTYGTPNNEKRVGPKLMKLFNDQFLLVGGSIYDTV